MCSQIKALQRKISEEKEKTSRAKSKEKEISVCVI